MSIFQGYQGRLHRRRAISSGLSLSPQTHRDPL
jgi:hypothetical protein